jgi:hypothetical protein
LSAPPFREDPLEKPAGGINVQSRKKYSGFSKNNHMQTFPLLLYFSIIYQKSVSICAVPTGKKATRHPARQQKKTGRRRDLGGAADECQAHPVDPRPYGRRRGAPRIASQKAGTFSLLCCSKLRSVRQGCLSTADVVYPAAIYP